jgi:hypothetical protein
VSAGAREPHLAALQGLNASSQAFAVILLIVCRLLAPGSPAGRVRPSGQYGVFSIAAFCFELQTTDGGPYFSGRLECLIRFI